MPTPPRTAVQNLAAMFERKYAEMVANGATDEQAIVLLRAMWLEHLTGSESR